MDPNAIPFAPRTVHSSQPAIGRRNSCNPTFTPTKPSRRASLRAQTGTALRTQHQNGQQQSGQQHRQSKKGQHDPQKQNATSFASEAFARKEDAMRAYAKKMAAQRAALERSANFAVLKDQANGTVEHQRNTADPQVQNDVSEEHKRKMAAQKGYSRRHSQKNNKRNSVKQKSKPEQSSTASSTGQPKVIDKENDSEHVIHSSTPTDGTSSSANSKTTSAEKASNTPSTDQPKVTDDKNALEHAIHSSSTPTDGTSSSGNSKTPSPEKANTSELKADGSSLLTNPKTTNTEKETTVDVASTLSNSQIPSVEMNIATTFSKSQPRESSISPSISTVTSIDVDGADPIAIPKPSLSISSIPSLIIEPRSPTVSNVTSYISTVSSPSTLSRVTSCDINIGTVPRISAVSTSDNSAPSICSTGSSYRPSNDTALSSGKWCPSCAGVGLHIAALLAELSQQRTESTSANRLSSGASASGSLSSKSGWKRMMSQTIIGDRGANKAAAEQKRLQHQVDVLSTTVSYLYEKLQATNRAGPDVDAAFNRCCIRR